MFALPLEMSSNDQLQVDDPGDWERIDALWPYCVLIIVNVLILSPICIRLTWSYYQKRDDHMYDTRRPGVVTILNCASIFMIMTYLPLHILCFEILWKNNGEWQEWCVVPTLHLSFINQHLPNYDRRYEIAAYFTMEHLFFELMLLRIFLSFFDFYIARLLFTQWKCFLSAEHTENQPFLLRHRSLLGISYEFV